MSSVGDGIFARSIRSGTWYLFSAFGQRGISTISFFVLARLLLPEDYGVIAIALMVVAIMNQFTTISFGDALMQRQDDIDVYMDPVWTFDLLRCSVLAVAIFFFAPFVGAFFHIIDPSSVWLLRLSGLFILLPAFANTRMLYLFRDLNLRRYFYRDIAAQLAFACTAILVAVFVSASPWALFAGYIAQSSVGVLISYLAYPAHPSFDLRFHLLRPLLGYMKWVFGQEFLDVILMYFDKLVVGRLLDTTQLGLYGRSKDLASTATNTVSSLLDKVGFAAFAKVQTRPEKIREGFFRSVDMLLLLSIPLTLLLLFEGGAIIQFLLGDNWLGIVLPMKVFAFGNLFLGLSGIATPLLGAIGRPDINFRANILKTALSIIVIFVGYQVAGLLGIAYGIVLVWIVMSVVLCVACFRLMQMRWSDALPGLSGVVAGFFLTLFVDVGLRLLRGPESSAWVLVADIILIALTYYAALWMVDRTLGRGPFATLWQVLGELRKTYRRKMRPGAGAIPAERPPDHEETDLA
jgi:PST family polysaccharide transporter/lipopolysaccharide exporter